jgi:hypothetical protein
MLTNDYVAQQAQHFGARRRVADEQPLGTSQNDRSDFFSNFPYTIGGEVTQFENTQRPRVSRSFRLTIEMVNIHTCRYVKRSRE